jgi:hypothetical protein
MASNQTSLPTSHEWTSKYGRITIFTGENYPEFSITCQAALIAAGAWDIVTSSEEEPTNGGNARRED